MALSSRLVGYLGALSKYGGRAVLSVGSGAIALGRQLRGIFPALGVRESRDLARYLEQTALPPPPTPTPGPAPRVGSLAGAENPSLPTTYRYITETTYTDPDTGEEETYRTPIDSTTPLTEGQIGDLVVGRITSEVGSDTRGVFIPADELPPDIATDIISFEYRGQ